MAQDMDQRIDFSPGWRRQSARMIRESADVYDWSVEVGS
jgi:hypothetical protein